MSHPGWKVRLIPVTLLIIAAMPIFAWPRGIHTPVREYDPARDAEEDIRLAVVEAQRTGKRVLIEVGGRWCSWCHTMDRFFSEHADLLAFREKHFVMVKVNYSKENENKAVLGKYPKIPGYPHIFILDADGELLHSQDTSPLESGNSYNLGRFFKFLRKWAPTGSPKS